MSEICLSIRTFTLGHMLSRSAFSPIADFYARRKI